MSKIFISHTTEDNDLSRKLARHLRLDGAEVWIYYTEVEVEDSLPGAFKQAIEWCDTLLLLWSKDSYNSDIVKKEYRRAFVLNKTIIICVLDDTEQTHGLCKSLNVDFKDFDKGYDRLTKLLNLKIAMKGENNGSRVEDDTENGSGLKIFQFRLTPGRLSEDKAVVMIKKFDFFDIKRNGTGSGIDRQLQIREIAGDQVIFDPISDLVWQHGGAQNSMWYDEAKSWIASINQHGYAGYNDWRLPTLEEAMSLMKSKKNDRGLYIDAMFSNKQITTWTSDMNENASRAWVVFFNYGSCYMNCFDFNNYVRAVRSEKNVR